jgi:chaperonin GroES
MNIRPLGDRIIVEVAPQSETTESGLYIPASTVERPDTGTVVAVGEGSYTTDGALIPVGVEVGETVLFNPHAGQPVKGSDTLFMFFYRDLTAVLEG